MRLTLVLAGMIFTGACCAFGQELAEEGTAAAIRSLERAWTVGQSRNDNHALDLIFDNALVYVEYNKLVSKGEYLARIRQASPSQNEITPEPMTVHLFDNTAIVVGSYREQQVQNGRRLAKRWRFVDTWVYKNSRWVLVAAAATPINP